MPTQTSGEEMKKTPSEDLIAMRQVHASAVAESLNSSQLCQICKIHRPRASRVCVACKGRFGPHCQTNCGVTHLLCRPCTYNIILAMFDSQDIVITIFAFIGAHGIYGMPPKLHQVFANWRKRRRDLFHSEEEFNRKQYHQSIQLHHRFIRRVYTFTTGTLPP